MARKNTKRSSESGIALGLLFVMIVAGLTLYNQDLAILLVVGVIPTLSIALSEKGRWRSVRSQTVGMLNLAGVFIYCMKVVNNPAEFDYIIGHPMTWIVMWGLAAFGYALLYVGPFVASKVLEMINFEKNKSLQKQKQDIIDVWGPEVAHAEEKQPEKKFIQPRRS